jgi:hypothetical protein
VRLFHNELLHTYKHGTLLKTCRTVSQHPTHQISLTLQQYSSYTTAYPGCSCALIGPAVVPILHVLGAGEVEEAEHGAGEEK